MSGVGEEGETVDSEAYDGFNKDKGEVEYDTNDKCLIYAFEVHLMVVVMSKAVGMIMTVTMLMTVFHFFSKVQKKRKARICRMWKSG
jgi:hypothetical protein